ncbi:hypothetical protein OUZ56_020733 [Daphnia magna]|uniref:Uncharacterized protein n=1 Tax=Daphnia magna TaxID=35525 RepID=A0ABQ9ZFA2_9CRUS|nr:hypothetical protein OUZ56_020733 [Daphnia magna]
MDFNHRPASFVHHLINNCIDVSMIEEKGNNASRSPTWHDGHLFLVLTQRNNWITIVTQFAL